MSYQVDMVVYGINCEVDFDYSKGRPAVMYLSNGDPGYPAEPDEVVVNSIFIGDQDLMEHLQPSFISQVEEKCYEKGAEIDSEKGHWE